MFYAHYVLSKRGPLARIWLAAHWDKKLTKAHVFETNLEDSVETIISPQVKMALRTSGHLLLGVVRIYNRKAKYLLADCNEAFVKIKMAFRSGVVDLPEESREAQHNQIYIVEEFPNFDTPLPDITDFDVNRHLTLNQSRIDEITMPDEAPTTLPMDESYGGVMVGGEMDGQYGDALHSVFYKGDDQKAGKDLGFMGGEAMKDGAFGEIDEGGILADNFLKDGGGLFGEAQEESFLGEGFGRKEPQEEIPMETADGAMDNQIMSPAPPPAQEQQEEQQPQEEAKEQEDPNKSEGEKMDAEKVDIDAPMEIVEGMVEASATNLQQQPIEEVQQAEQQQQQQQVNEEANKEQTAAADANFPAPEETVIKPPETTFALEPLNVSDVHNVRIRRKRKLIIDHVIELDGQTMREQLRDVDDIVTTLDMAPPTKRLMLWKEMGGVDKLFSLPCQMTGDRVNKIFTLNLHNTVPSDLADMTGTQLQEKFGESIAVEEPEPEQQQQQQQQSIVDESIPTERHDVTESTVEILRKDTTDTSIQYQASSIDPMSTSALNFHVPSNDQSSMIQGNNDLCMNQINALNDSDDEYDAMSNGPPSVGDSVGAPSPSIPLGVDCLLNMDNVLGEPQPPSINDTLASADTRVSIEPEQREREPEPEGTAYADDLEDLRWNKRTQHLLTDLERKFKAETEVSFFRLSDGITRKQAVSKFYSLLVLAKQEAVNLSQSEVFGDVYIKEGSKFNNVFTL